MILKAINKEPSERYQSATALADDLRRFLADRPIEARRSSVREHFWRWCRRNPALASAMAAALLFLLVGSAGVFTQWRRAEANLELATRNAEQAQERSAEALQRKTEAERSAAEAERRRVEADENLENALDAADRLLSRVGARRLAPIPKAEQIRRELLQDALMFYQRLANRNSEDPAIRRHVGLAQTRVGDIHRELGKLQDAEKAYRDALEVLEPLAVRTSGEALDQERLGHALNNLGVVLDDAGESVEAERILRRVHELRKKLVDSSPTTAKYRNDFGQTCNNLAVLLYERNRPDEAKPFYQQARELILQLAEEFPMEPEYQEALARDYFNHGVRQKDEDSAIAEESLRLALAIYQQLHERNPTIAHYREMLGRTHSSLGDSLRILKRSADSEAQHREAARVMDQLAADFPTNADFQHELGGVLHNLAMVLNNTGQLTPAREFTERAVQHQKQALKITPSARDYRRYLANHLVQLQRILFQLKLHDQVSQAALELSNVPGLPVDRYYQAACFTAGCIHLVQNDSALEGEAREQLIQAYGDQSMKILRQTIAKGFKDFALLRKDTDLGPLRDRDDFQALLLELSGI